jgi:hypothetical protein
MPLLKAYDAPPTLLKKALNVVILYIVHNVVVVVV